MIVARALLPPDDEPEEHHVIPCHDTQSMLDLCHCDHVRYCGLITGLAPSPTSLDELMERYWVDDGRLVDRGADACKPKAHAYYVDSRERPAVLACVGGVKPHLKLRLEGELQSADDRALRAWIRELAPAGVATTHEDIRRCLSEELGVTDWGEAGQYTVTAEDFKPRMVHPVRRLSPAERPLWRRFVEGNMDDSMVSGRKGCGSVVREFEFMCMGLPVDYYVTEKEGEIAGVVSIGPSTDRCDNIGTLFVAPEHRRQGFGRSLLSAAVQDILARGRQPFYFAGGDPGPLLPLLIGLGYRPNSTFYWTERYMWYDWVLAQEY
jgi:GNAT superfamily N-acetyltransferase